jgi:hypothetical protein
MKSARRVVAQGEPSDGALARLQALILDETAQPILVYAIRGERAMFDEMIQRLRDGEIPITALSGTGSTGKREYAPTAVSPVSLLMWDNQRAVGLELMNELVAIAKENGPARRALMATWESRFGALRRKWHTAYTATLPVLMMPAMTAASAAESRNKSELAATAILLAAERHRRKTGHWPKSVADIDIDILPRPPLDPFSGNPFRMTYHDGELRIYSVGPDLQDGGGDYDPKRWMQGGPDDVGARAWDASLRGREPAM